MREKEPKPPKAQAPRLNKELQGRGSIVQSNRGSRMKMWHLVLASFSGLRVYFVLASFSGFRVYLVLASFSGLRV